MRYSVQAAARATGISEHRLRTWERRYGVPNPSRSTSGRRLYDDDDLMVVRAMARLVEAGIPASEAAQAALAGRREEPSIAANTTTHPMVDVLLAAARAFDAEELEKALQVGFDELGTAGAISQVVMPFLRAVGDAWETARLSVANEHFASEVVRRVLARRGDSAVSSPDDAPVVVMACPAGEQHDLGLLALWVLLTEAGFRAIYLGADVPAAELVATCISVEAVAVVLAATTPTALPGLGLTARRFIEDRVRCRVLLAGRALATQDEAHHLIGERLPLDPPAASAWIRAEFIGSE